MRASMTEKGAIRETTRCSELGEIFFNDYAVVMVFL